MRAIDGDTLAINERRTGKRIDLPSIRRSLGDAGADAARHRFVVLPKQCAIEHSIGRISRNHGWPATLDAIAASLPSSAWP